METLRYPTPKAWAEDACNAIREKDRTTDPIVHENIPDRIRSIPSGGNVDLSGVTAQADDVSQNVKFIGSDGVLKKGTMPENEAQTVVLDGSQTIYEIPEGHHPAGGKVRIYTMERRLTPSTAEKTYTAPDDTVYTKIILDPIPDIYKDISGADAIPAEVAAGSKFFGASGVLEAGTAAKKSGKQGGTVVSNGNIYVDKGFHDGTSYISVSVPQDIKEGEDSTGCTAGVLDVRKGKTFLSGGIQQTGAIGDVEPPEISMEIDEEFSPITLLINATSSVEKTGIVTAGASASSSARILKYTGETTVTPSSNEQKLATAGKYCTSDIIVSPAAGGGDYFMETKEVEFQSGTSVINIPLDKITDVRSAFVVRSKEPSNYLGYYEVLTLSIDKLLNGQDYIVMVTSENWVADHNAFGYMSGGNFVIDISNISGDFYGSYRCYVIGT